MGDGGDCSRFPGQGVRPLWDWSLGKGFCKGAVCVCDLCLGEACQWYFVLPLFVLPSGGRTNRQAAWLLGSLGGTNKKQGGFNRPALPLILFIKVTSASEMPLSKNIFRL